MELDVTSGRFSELEFMPSPNCDNRTDPNAIDLLVIHNITLPKGEFEGPRYIAPFFLNQLEWNAHPYFKEIEGLKVSSHLCIFREGTALQFVPLFMRAWHAGVSTFEDRTACNDFSIGIELEGTDEIPYTQDQYQTLARLTKAIQNAYPAITAKRIVGHCDIAPGRKTDPGPSFDWDQYFRLLR